MNTHISIDLHYRLLNRKDWVIYALSPAEYFDLDPNEIPEFDSVPQHNHACDFVNIPVETLSETKIVVVQKSPPMRRAIHETFWNEGRCRLIERIDDGNEPYRELVICSEVQRDPQRLEVIRMVDENDRMSVTSHVIIDTLSDGSERETRLLEQSDTQSS